MERQTDDMPPFRSECEGAGVPLLEEQLSLLRHVDTNS